MTLRTRLTIWLLPSHIHLPAPPWAADLFSPKRWSPVRGSRTTQQMAGAQEAILGQSSAHSFATGPWQVGHGVDGAPFFSVAPTKKWKDYFLGWPSKRVKVQVECWLQSLVIKCDNYFITSPVSYFCWLQADSDAQEVRRWNCCRWNHTNTFINPDRHINNSSFEKNETGRSQNRRPPSHRIGSPLKNHHLILGLVFMDSFTCGMSIERSLDSRSLHLSLVVDNDSSVVLDRLTEGREGFGDHMSHVRKNPGPIGSLYWLIYWLIIIIPTWLGGIFSYIAELTKVFLIAHMFGRWSSRQLKDKLANAKPHSFGLSLS